MDDDAQVEAEAAKEFSINRGLGALLANMGGGKPPPASSTEKKELKDKKESQEKREPAEDAAPRTNEVPEYDLSSMGDFSSWGFGSSDTYDKESDHRKDRKVKDNWNDGRRGNNRRFQGQRRDNSGGESKRGRGFQPNDSRKRRNEDGDGNTKKNKNNRDEDVYGPRDLVDWNDVLEFNDDHDRDWFDEQTKLCSETYGPFVRPKYLTHLGKKVKGYLCELCLIEINTLQIVEQHCNGKNHLRKKNLWDINQGKIGKKELDSDLGERGARGNFRGPNSQQRGNIRQSSRDRSPVPRNRGGYTRNDGRGVGDNRDPYYQQMDPNRREFDYGAKYDAPFDNRYQDYRDPGDRGGYGRGDDPYHDDPYHGRQYDEPYNRRQEPTGYGYESRFGLPEDAFRRTEDTYRQPEEERYYRRSSPPLPAGNMNAALSRRTPPPPSSGLDRSHTGLRTPPPPDRGIPPQRSGSHGAMPQTSAAAAPPGRDSKEETGAGEQPLSGGPIGMILKGLAECSVKNENDAELATHVISFLLKSFKEYHQAKGTNSIIHLLEEAEVKFGIVVELQKAAELQKAMSSNQKPSQPAAKELPLKPEANRSSSIPTLGNGQPQYESAGYKNRK